MPQGVVILPSYYESIRPLEAADRLEVLEAVIEYGLYNTEPQLPPLLYGFFLLMKPNIDASRNRHEAAIRNGKLGGRPKNQSENQTENQNQNQPGNQEIETDIEMEKEIDSEMDAGDRGGERVVRGSGGERTVLPPGEAGELFRQWLEALDAGRRLDAADLSNRLFRMGYNADIQSRSWRER